MQPQASRIRGRSVGSANTYFARSGMKSAHSRADVEHAVAIHLHRQDSSPMKFQLIDRRHYALAQNDDSVDDKALAGVSDSFDAAELIPAAASAFEPILSGQDPGGRERGAAVPVIACACRVSHRREMVRRASIAQARRD